MIGTDRFDRWVLWGAIGVAAWLALFPITSVDAYYHLAVGKRILAERAIPSRGVGSATFGSAAWHDNEWGFQVLAAAIGGSTRDRDGATVLTSRGRAGLIVLRAALLAATLALVSGALRRRGVGPLPRAFAAWLLAFLTFGNLFWAIRPQIVSYAIFAALLWLLEADRAGSRWAAPAMLAATAAWANVHAAFPVGVALVGAEGLGELWDGRRGGSARGRGIRLLATAAAMPLAAACNPHGFSQVVHPLRYLLEPGIHAGNAEWLPPDFVHLPLLVLTAAWASLSWWADKPRSTAGGLRIALFFALLTTALRHLPFTAMALVASGAPAAVAAARRGGWRVWLEPISAFGGADPRRRLAALGFVLVGVVGLSGAKFIGPVPRFAEAPVRPMPESAVRFLLREGVEGAGFNAYRFGGFLMFRMYPQERVFMDGRNDLYGSFRHTVYNPILRADPGWERLWSEAETRWDIGWVLVDASDPLASGLEARADWLRADAASGEEADGTGIAVFLRNTPENRELAATRAAPLAGSRSRRSDDPR